MVQLGFSLVIINLQQLTSCHIGLFMLINIYKKKKNFTRVNIAKT